MTAYWILQSDGRSPGMYIFLYTIYRTRQSKHIALIFFQLLCMVFPLSTGLMLTTRLPSLVSCEIKLLPWQSKFIFQKLPNLVYTPTRPMLLYGDNSKLLWNVSVTKGLSIFFLRFLYALSDNSFTYEITKQ